MARKWLPALVGIGIAAVFLSVYLDMIAKDRDQISQMIIVAAAGPVGRRDLATEVQDAA